ncbi:heme lyase subunit NrfE [Salmonella enterica subsp. enterica serovar Heidelberg str. RI-11-014316]|nr:heme lyase subunit NrfE [Salmonella enterica subsp. enterica serovar Heidelberg str. RI-11-014316]
MMEPGIHWNLLHDWYAVMGRKNRTGSLRHALIRADRRALDLGWGLLMVCGALLSGWRGRKRDA